MTLPSPRKGQDFFRTFSSCPPDIVRDNIVFKIETQKDVWEKKFLEDFLLLNEIVFDDPDFERKCTTYMNVFHKIPKFLYVNCLNLVFKKLDVGIKIPRLGDRNQDVLCVFFVKEYNSIIPHLHHMKNIFNQPYNGILERTTLIQANRNVVNNWLQRYLAFPDSCNDIANEIFQIFTCSGAFFIIFNGHPFIFPYTKRKNQSFIILDKTWN